MTIAFGAFPLLLPLAITAFGAAGCYFSLAITAFGAFEFSVPKYYHRLGLYRANGRGGFGSQTAADPVW